MQSLLLKPPVESDAPFPGTATNVPGQVALTPAFPSEIVDPVMYKAAENPTLTMHRTDGARISFVNGYYETRVRATQNFLDYEIAQNLPGIRRATEDEVKQARFLANPIKATADQVAQDTEARVRSELSETFAAEMVRMRAAMAAEFEAKLKELQGLGGLNKPAGDAGADTRGVAGEAKHPPAAGQATAMTGTLATQPLTDKAGVDAAPKVPATPAPVLQAARPLISPVSTAQLAAIAAGQG